MAMELLAGEPLGARVACGPLSPADTSTIALQVLDALHARGLIHFQGSQGRIRQAAVIEPLVEHPMLTRREALLRCAAFGSLNLVAPALGLTDAVSAFEQAEQAATARSATQWNEIGPFYKRLAPNTSPLRAPGDPGLGLAVSGRVADDRAVHIWSVR